MSSNLWLPENLEDLFLVTIDPQQSTDSEFELMQLLNRCARDWVDGRLDTGTYMDILETAGIDPVWFIGSAETHVERLIKSA